MHTITQLLTRIAVSTFPTNFTLNIRHSMLLVSVQHTAHRTMNYTGKYLQISCSLIQWFFLPHVIHSPRSNSYLFPSFRDRSHMCSSFSTSTCSARLKHSLLPALTRHNDRQNQLLWCAVALQHPCTYRGPPNDQWCVWPQGEIL